MTDQTKPSVGITVSGNGLSINNLWLWMGVWLGGARPVALSAELPEPDRVPDALLLTGGTDIFPDRYGAVPKDGYRYDQARDELETAWIERADQADIPLMAICRGLQLLNVARGGTLHVDVRTIAQRRNYPGAGIWPSLTFRKKAKVKPDTRLESIVRTTDLTINALHTQAADAVGDGLQVTARDGDNVVQALEDKSRSFCLAVQFHPELLLYRKAHRSLFSALGEAARAHARFKS